MSDNKLSETVIGAAIKVHKALGPGLLENVYKQCLFYELSKQKILVEKEKHLPVFYDEIHLDCGYRIDLLVEESLVVEIKSVKVLDDVHLAQTLTYLKLGEYDLGLLINFNVPKLVMGVKRVINCNPQDSLDPEPIE